MRKTFVIILAVALLGGLSVYATKQKDGDSAQATAQPSTSATNSVNTSTNSTSTSNSVGSAYKDGTFAGTTAETPYGPVQVSALISGGKIVNIHFLKMPDDERRSQEITSMAEPQLKQAALNSQNATDLDMVTGATSTYYGYQESLQAALDKAKNI